jgi:ribosomal protein S18 acetylase RimI-like enzyme
MDVEVVVVREATTEIMEAMDRLPQLSTTATPLDAAALERLVCSEATGLLVARVHGKIVGALTLVMFRVPTGLRARIEDVVVDESARGHGVGAALTQEALRLAQRDGARTVDLTSRPRDRRPSGCMSGSGSDHATHGSTASLNPDASDDVAE